MGLKFGKLKSLFGGGIGELVTKYLVEEARDGVEFVQIALDEGLVEFDAGGIWDLIVKTVQWIATKGDPTPEEVRAFFAAG